MLRRVGTRAHPSPTISAFENAGNTRCTRARRGAIRVHWRRRCDRATRGEWTRSAARRTRWREQSIAPLAGGEAETFRVTHPFHPLRGRTFQLVDCRQTWGEDRVYFYDDSGRLPPLPLQWADAVHHH